MSYYKRKAEIQKRLNEAKANIIGNSVASLKDQEAFQNAVNTYFDDSRPKILEDALNFLRDDSKTAEQQRNRWENHMNTKSTEACKVLVDLMKNKSATPFNTVISDMLSQESVFFLKLANMQFCDVMCAKLQEHRKQFDEEKKKLLDKWTNLQNENKNINASIEDISAKLLAIYKDGLNKAGSLKDKARVEIKDWLKVTTVAGKLVAGVTIPAFITQTIGLAADTINTFMPNAKEMAARFDQLYRSEENVVVIMFGNTRKSVKEFLEKTNHDKAEKDYYDALKHAQEVAANMLTNGQKEDALLFVNKAEEITRKPLTSFTDAYKGFVNEFKEIFIGPVGERTIKDLLKKERWDATKDEWQRMNVQTELKKIYDDSRDWINVDMFDLTPEVKAEIVAALKKERDRLDLALSQGGDRSILDAVGFYLSIIKATTFGKVKDS
jgi:hypothetical protein